MDRNKTLSIDTGALLRGVLTLCVSIELLFFTLDYHVNMASGASGAIKRLFSTAREDSLPGWFAIMQTAMVAVTIWLIWAIVRHRGATWRSRGWAVIALFFTYLAFDDGAHIHERVGTWFDGAGESSRLGAWMLDMFPSYRWQIVFMPVFALMGLFVFGFLLRELRGWRPKSVVFIAFGCLALAVLIDFFEGLAVNHPLNPYTAIADAWQLDYWTARTFGDSPYDTLVHFSKSFEECLEMFAMTLLWVVFLQHFTRVANGFQLRFDQTPLVAIAESTDQRRMADTRPAVSTA